MYSMSFIEQQGQQSFSHPHWIIKVSGLNPATILFLTALFYIYGVPFPFKIRGLKQPLMLLSVDVHLLIISHCVKYSTLCHLDCPLVADVDAEGFNVPSPSFSDSWRDAGRTRRAHGASVWDELGRNWVKYFKLESFLLLSWTWSHTVMAVE